MSSKDVMMLTEFLMHVFRLANMSFWVPKKRVSCDFRKGNRPTVFGKQVQRVKFPNNDGTDEKFIMQPKITMLLSSFNL